MKVHLVIHTTSGIEFEIVPDKNGEPDLNKSITGRWFVCDEEEDLEDGEDYEAIEKDRVARIAAKRGWELVGEVWS